MPLPYPPPGIAGLSTGVVKASAFRTYHTALNHQDDFINALSAARDFSAKASAELGLRIYPYSVFHIFFEQYLNVTRDALLLVGLPCLAVFLLTWAFTGSLWGSGILLLMLTSLLVHLGGAMYLADIQVNAGKQRLSTELGRLGLVMSGRDFGGQSVEWVVLEYYRYKKLLGRYHAVSPAGSQEGS